MREVAYFVVVFDLPEDDFRVFVSVPRDDEVKEVLLRAVEVFRRGFEKTLLSRDDFPRKHAWNLDDCGRLPFRF